MTTEAMEPIEFKLVETNVFTRWDCDICGGVTEKDAVLIESETPGMGRVCPMCLKEGDIDGQLTRLAEWLERQENPDWLGRRAKEIRSFIGRLRLPTYEQWKAAEEAATRRYEEACRRHEEASQAAELAPFTESDGDIPF